MHQRPPHTKLIIVDGNMGSGKSTTAEWLATVMEECRIPHRLVSESERPHPVQVTRFLGRRAENASPDDHIAESVQKWTTFVDSAQRHDGITILDGQLFHFNIDLMLFLDADREQIVSHTHRIAEIAQRLNPTLIYLRAVDARTEIDDVFAARGLRFERQQIRRKTRYPYCVNRDLTGRKALVQLYSDYRRIADEVFTNLRWKKLLIDKTGSNWTDRNPRVVEAIFGHRFERPELDPTAHDIKVVCRCRVDISPLAGRRQIEGHLRIKNNPTLQSVEDLRSLETIGGTLDLRGTRFSRP